MSSDDELLVNAMSYEYMLLKQSYMEFMLLIPHNLSTESNEIKLYLYNSYSQVIMHLYEFMKACVVREFSKTKSNNNEFVKKYIIVEVEKLAKRHALTYDISKIDEFAESLRNYRNKIYGHVFKERFEDYPLASFYSNYHVYVVWLIQSIDGSWSSEISDLIKHSAIQDFSKMLTFGQSL